MPFAYNLVGTTYFVEVVDSSGCSASGSIRVEVDNRRDVFLPNVFTPNQDGVNENFMIFTGEGVTAIPSVRVYDRWGELVREAKNLQIGPSGAVVWDGTMKGEAMQPGVYVYVAEVLFLDQPQTPLVFKGDVTLLR